MIFYETIKVKNSTKTCLHFIINVTCLLYISSAGMCYLTPRKGECVRWSVTSGSLWSPGL